MASASGLLHDSSGSLITLIPTKPTSSFEAFMQRPQPSTRLFGRRPLTPAWNVRGSLAEREVLGVHLPGAQERAQVRSGRIADGDADLADLLIRVSLPDGLERGVRTHSAVIVIPPRPRGRDPRVERPLRGIRIGRLRVRR